MLLNQWLKYNWFNAWFNEMLVSHNTIIQLLSRLLNGYQQLTLHPTHINK